MKFWLKLPPHAVVGKSFSCYHLSWVFAALKVEGSWNLESTFWRKIWGLCLVCLQTGGLLQNAFIEFLCNSQNCRYHSQSTLLFRMDWISQIIILAVGAVFIENLMLGAYPTKQPNASHVPEVFKIVNQSLTENTYAKAKHHYNCFFLAPT